MCRILRHHHPVLPPRSMIVDFQHATHTQADGMAVLQQRL
jgi:hypothetical protein